MQTFILKHFNTSEISFETTCVAINLCEYNMDIAVFDEEVVRYTYFNSFDTKEINSNKEALIKFLSKFSKKYFLFSSNRLLLMPSSLFDKDKKNELFLYNFQNYNPVEKSIFRNHISQLNSDLLFDIGLDVIEILHDIAENLEIYHQGKVFLEICLLFQSEKKQNTSYLFIDVLEKSALIALFQNGKLNFFNSNLFINIHDLVFFIVSLIKQYEINQKAIEIYISGKVNFSGDEVIAEIKKFFTSVYPFEYTKNYSLSSGLQSIKSYTYNTFFNLPFCV